MDQVVKQINAEFQQEIKKLQAIQNKLLSLNDPRVQLQTQLTECDYVSKELDNMEGDAKLYKKNIFVLLPTELDEAKSTISNRIKLINSQIENIEAKGNDLLKEKESITAKLDEIQNRAKSLESLTKPK